MTIARIFKRCLTAARIDVASRARQEAAESGECNPAGARRAALTLPLSVTGASSIIRRLAIGIGTTSLIVVALAAPSLALDLKALRPGAYVPADVGCDGLGGATQMSFDGANFSGHYQLCRTDDLGDGKVRSTCVEAQGPNQPMLQDIDKDPDRTTADATVVIKSPTSFAYNGQAYRYCEAP